MGHALFLHVLIKPSPQPQVKLKGWQRAAQLPSLYPSGRRVESLLKNSRRGSGGGNCYILRKNFLLRLLRRIVMPVLLVTDPNYGRSFGKNTSPHGRTYWAELEKHWEEHLPSRTHVLSRIRSVRVQVQFCSYSQWGCHSRNSHDTGGQRKSGVGVRKPSFLGPPCFMLAFYSVYL